jgi:hypothetical protein
MNLKEERTMKKILLYTMAGLLGTGAFMACSDEDKGFAPTPIDPTTFTAEARTGGVKLSWKTPEGANYKYVKVTYTLRDTVLHELPPEGKACMRMASVYSDTILIDDLYKRYGVIDFELRPMTAKGYEGESHIVKGQSNPVPPIVKVVGDPIKLALTVGQLKADNPDSSEGSFANLIDGKTDTFWHMDWHSPTPFPHYIVVDLIDETKAAQFSYVCRNHSNKDNPKTINVYGSEAFDGTTFDPQHYNAEKLNTMNNLADGQAAKVDSPALVGTRTFRYLWLEVTASTTGNSYVALAELVVSRIKTATFNPETGETINN